MNTQKTLIGFLSAGALLALPAVAQSSSEPESHAAVARPCHYELEKQVNRRVRMSDVHGWKGVTATFEYSADHAADSYVGVSVQLPNGHWQANGTEHVTKSNVFGQTGSVVGAGNKAITGVFKFNVLKATGRDCPSDITKRFTRAYRFEGGMRVEKAGTAPPGLAGQCKTAPGHQKLYPHTSVYSGAAQSFTYDHSFTLFGLTLGSSTTLGKSAKITLTNHGKKAVWVCGVNTAGQAVPISEAAMLYAGPRIGGG